MIPDHPLIEADWVLTDRRDRALDETIVGLVRPGSRVLDLVIVNQVLPLLPNPIRLIEQSLRVGDRVAVTFPNFSHWKIRSQLFFTGKLPVTESLPYRWHETPHIRYLSIADFRETSRDMGWDIECERYVRHNGCPTAREIRILPNLRASLALFLLRKG